jgi:hypothetical protein
MRLGWNMGPVRLLRCGQQAIRKGSGQFGLIHLAIGILDRGCILCKHWHGTKAKNGSKQK